MQVLFGLDPKIGAVISAIIGIAIFVYKEAGKAMDKFTQIAGVAMILLTLYVVISSQPPVGEAIAHTVMPDKIDFTAIITIIGGTVGGYITFSGGHRLIDAGISGPEHIGEITRASVTGVVVTGIMRVLLFLATLGVIAAGMTLDKANPPASVFLLSTGNIGYKIFGIVMWAAAISSVIGAAYTSVSFIQTFSKKLNDNYRKLIIAFIVFSTAVFVFIGKPVTVLVVVGTLNGFILPITLGVMLLAAYNHKIVGSYHHPIWVSVFGIIVFFMTAYMSVMTIIKLIGA